MSVINILIDMGHPAHIHFYKYFIEEMQKKGHNVLVVSRPKDVMISLLRYYDIPHNIIGKSQNNLLRRGVNMPLLDLKLLRICKGFKPDVLTGIGSPYISQVSNVLRKTSVVFTDTEHAKWINRFSIPFADYVLTPSCFLKKIGEKQICYNGFHELAYLHPDRFRKEYCLTKDAIILRTSAWTASHDNGKRSALNRSKLLRMLSEYGSLVIFSENKPNGSYTPEVFHTLLSNSRLCISEGATVATEAALLGTPGIYISPLSGTMGNHIELSKYGLMESFERMPPLDHIESLLTNYSRHEFRSRRDLMLKDKIDVTGFMIDFFGGFE